MTTPATLPRATALIAEDEPLLAAALQADLAAVWPQLQVLGTVGDGHSAVRRALELQPDVLLFDIRMPGQTGLQAAAELADAWPEQGSRAFPQLVFVTAYDQYAVAAFETQAVDYILKPVQRERLKKTVQKLASALTDQAQTAIHSDNHHDSAPASTAIAPANTAPTPALLAQLSALLAQAGADLAPQAFHNPAPPRLTLIQASHTGVQGSALVMVPVAEVLYFEAADKYVRVICPTREVLIRTPLKELLPQLDAQQFWQIHRGTVVRAEAIARATRDEAGKLWVHLHPNHPDQPPHRLPVSRLYAHLFKAM
jgi:DNA-binding LytR/AlgR family response regulator